MSDEQVVDRFVGAFVSGEEWESSTSKYDDWFPPKGVQLTFSKANDNGRFFARVKVSNPGAWPANVQQAVEAAEYGVVGNKLSANVTLPGNFIVKETLSMVDGTNGKMVHLLEFPDGEVGFWICPSKPRA